MLAHGTADATLALALFGTGLDSLTDVPTDDRALYTLVPEHFGVQLQRV